MLYEKRFCLLQNNTAPSKLMQMRIGLEVFELSVIKLSIQDVYIHGSLNSFMPVSTNNTTSKLNLQQTSMGTHHKAWKFRSPSV